MFMFTLAKVHLSSVARFQKHHAPTVLVVLAAFAFASHLRVGSVDLARLATGDQKVLTAACALRTKVTNGLFDLASNKADLRLLDSIALHGKKKPTKTPVDHAVTNDAIEVQSKSATKHKRKRKTLEKAQSHKQPRIAYNLEEIESRYVATPVPRSVKDPLYEKTFDDDPAALLKHVYNQQQQLVANGSAKRRQLQYDTDEEDLIQNTRSSSFKGLNGPGRRGYESNKGNSYSPAVGHPTQGPTFGNSMSSSKSLDNEYPVALIDTFPRRKQKQLYSLIGGIESGIRSQRQQTENLENQLENLKEILGIGEDAGSA